MAENRTACRIGPWSAVVTFWGAAFWLSCSLTTLRTGAGPAEHSPSVARALLGETCRALSGHFYETADKYFHKGVEHIRPRAFKDSIFQRAADEVSPKDHVHLEGEEIKEMMPWLCLSIRTNPHRLQTYLVAAFWLATDARRPDLALQILSEAQYNIPGSHEIQLEKGRLLLRQNRLKEAGEALDTGLAFWPGNRNPRARAMQCDKAELLLYRAVLYEVDGNIPAAVAALNEILTIFPRRTGLKERIRELQSGKEPAILAQERLRQLLRSDAQHRHDATCSGDHEHNGHDDEPHTHQGGRWPQPKGPPARSKVQVESEGETFSQSQ